MGVSPAQHHIIKETSESLGELLQGVFRDSGYKRVHLVVAAPKQEAIEGKLPAVSVYLYNLTLDEEGPRSVCERVDELGQGGKFLGLANELRRDVRHRPPDLQADRAVPAPAIPIERTKTTVQHRQSVHVRARFARRHAERPGYRQTSATTCRWQVFGK